MNLANRAFKASFKNLLEKILGTSKAGAKQFRQALGESATEISLKEIPKVTDEARLKKIAEGTEQFRSSLTSGVTTGKGVRETEAVVEGLAKVALDKAEYLYQDKMKQIDDIFQTALNDEERKIQLSDLADTWRSYVEGMPIETKPAMKLFSEGKYNEGKSLLRDMFMNNALKRLDAELNNALALSFETPEYITEIIEKNREKTLKSAFARTTTDKGESRNSLFDIEKEKYFREQEKLMPKSAQAEFRKKFDEEYKIPQTAEELAAASLEDLEKPLRWYNSRVKEKDQIKYGLRQEIQDKLAIHTLAQKELGEFGTLNAVEVNENTVAKLFAAGGGLVTNMAKGFAYFKGVEEFTAQSIGRAMDYFEKLPRLRTRNNELVLEAGAQFTRYRNDLEKTQRADLHNRIRYYIEHLSEGELSFVPYNNHSIVVNQTLQQQQNLDLADIEFANKIINTTRIAKKQADYIVNRNYAGAETLPSRFRDIDGTTLVDTEGMNKKSQAFGFVDNFFPIVPTQEYRDHLAQKQATGYETELGFISRQLADLMNEKKIELTFFTRMRSYGKTGEGSILKNTPSLRRSPGEELLTYAKALDNFYKGIGTQYFDQIDAAHSIYNVTAKYGRKEQLARVKLLQNFRKQYEADINPKGLGKSKIGKALSAVLGFEATAALTRWRMAFFNLWQGVELGAPIHGVKQSIESLAKMSGLQLSESKKMLLGVLHGDFRKTDFVSDIMQGKLSKGVLYGDDAIAANNIVFYFRDDPVSVVNMADVSAMLYEGLDKKLLQGADPVLNFFRNTGELLTIPFKLSESVARSSTVDAATRHFLDSARKVVAEVQAHPEMSNPEAVRMFAKELHLDAFNNAWKTDKILGWLKGRNVAEALTDNKVLQEMSRDYAFASVKHQLYEYDAINQSWLKAKIKNVSGLGAIPLTFKSWGMYWTEYMAGIAGAAANGDWKPLRNLVLQTGVSLAALSWLATLTEDDKYKKGKKQDFDRFMKKYAHNVASYGRGRNPAFTLNSIVSMPLDEIGGLTTPVAGGLLWTGAQVADLINKGITFGQAKEEIFPYLSTQGMNAMKHEVVWRKINNFVDNARELGLLEEEKRKRKK